jgi:hypothetical protein
VKPPPQSVIDFLDELAEHGYALHYVAKSRSYKVIQVGPGSGAPVSIRTVTGLCRLYVDIEYRIWVEKQKTGRKMRLATAIRALIEERGSKGKWLLEIDRDEGDRLIKQLGVEAFNLASFVKTISAAYRHARTLVTASPRLKKQCDRELKAAQDHGVRYRIFGRMRSVHPSDVASLRAIIGAVRKKRT